MHLHQLSNFFLLLFIFSVVMDNSKYVMQRIRFSLHIRTGKGEICNDICMKICRYRYTNKYQDKKVINERKLIRVNPFSTIKRHQRNRKEAIDPQHAHDMGSNAGSPIMTSLPLGYALPKIDVSQGDDQIIAFLTHCPRDVTVIWARVVFIDMLGKLSVLI